MFLRQEDGRSSADDAKVIHVTRPFLPPLEEFQGYLREIWESGWLTNNAKFHQQLELALADFLGIGHISLFVNGTLGLISALQALRISGEVITTPYSFVATTHALHWNGITPVFCDIEPDRFTLDPDMIEAAITPRTAAILPVHVYGNPCQTERIQRIADRYGLRVIYDACHAFGVKVNGQSILEAGDLAVLSFHATKVFNTFEGGAIVSRDANTKQRIDYLKNFGFADEVTVVAPGINAKMNEIQAAFGLLQLQYVDRVIKARKGIACRYREALRDVEGISLPGEIEGVEHNYAYVPILIDRWKFGLSRDEVYQQFRRHGIFARRYFYPLISQFPSYRGLPSAIPSRLPVAERTTKQILCLPIYPDLTQDEQCRIITLLRGRFRNGG